MFRFTSALFGALLLAMALALGQAMVEPASKIKFDDSISLPGTGSGLSYVVLGWVECQLPRGSLSPSATEARLRTACMLTFSTALGLRVLRGPRRGLVAHSADLLRCAPIFV